MPTLEIQNQGHWIVRTTDFKQTPFAKNVATYSKKDFDLSCLKKLGFFWLLALMSVFVPVLHFFLVPTFFLLGIFAFSTQMKSTHYIPQGQFTCPGCRNEIQMKKFYFENEKRFHCQHCRQQLVLNYFG